VGGILLSLEEGDIEQGGVKIQKLEEVHLGDKIVIEVSLGAVKF
jgi:hypothetical protein